MDETLRTIEQFLSEHHVVNLATSGQRLWCCSLFYAYTDGTFVVASDESTEHIRNILDDNRVAGTVVLETETVGKIQGLQFYGLIEPCGDACQKIYFERFPYARIMNPRLWTIRLDEIKFTDNRLGFGKKLIWKRKF